MDEGEEHLRAAIREFKEETTIDITGPLIPLTSVKQKSGKLVHVWAAEQNFATDNIKSNTFTLEWPPRSGKMVEFPEMDKFEWFDQATTLLKLIPGQIPFVYEVLEYLKANKKS
jgi:predicted NUDIX family NTP pyrophosphohydrolase